MYHNQWAGACYIALCGGNTLEWIFDINLIFNNQCSVLDLFGWVEEEASVRGEDPSCCCKGELWNKVLCWGFLQYWWPLFIWWEKVHNLCSTNDNMMPCCLCWGIMTVMYVSIYLHIFTWTKRKRERDRRWCLRLCIPWMISDTWIFVRGYYKFKVDDDTHLRMG